MSGTFFLGPQPILINSNDQSVQSNATVTASGDSVYIGFGTKEVSLIVNIKASPTGTAPTLTYSLQEVDPGDGTTLLGSAVSTLALNSIGTSTITLRATKGGAIRVSWVIGGTGSPTFTQVYATLGTKATTVISGLDGSGNELPVLVDGSGRLDVAVTNPSIGTNASAAPASSTQVGGTDGANLRPLRVFDADTGAGTQYVLGTVLRKSSSGGSVEAGTSSDPLRTDPTGTTTQPVSAASLPLPTGAATEATVSTLLTSATFTGRINTQGQKPMATSTPVVIASDQSTLPVSGTVTSNIGTTGGLALDATLTGGTQKAIVRGGAKGATTAADVTSTAEGTDHQALDVQIYHGGSAVNPTQTRALTSSDVVSSEVTKWMGSTAPSVGQKTSASSIPVVIASDQSSITATNPSVGSTGSAVPASATQMGGSDGTNLRAPRVFDADSGAGSQYVLGAVLRKSASGGSVEAGTSSDPLRVDPTGTTTQPVSGTVTANIGTSGSLALDATLTGGTQKAIVRGGAKGATTAADVTSTAEGTDHQALDVQIYHGGSAVNPTQIRALTSSDVVTAAQGTAAALSGAWPVKITDGTNTLPTGDSAARAIFEKITDGTNTATIKAASTAAVATDTALVVAISPNNSITASNPSVSTTGSAVPASATLVGVTDGTNLRAPRGYDADTGVGSEYVLGAVLRKSASGGSVEAGTSSDPLRIDPTGTTTQPVSDAGGSLTVDTTQLPAALVGGRLDTNTGAWLGSTAPTVGSKTSADSIPVVIASDQAAIPVSGSITATNPSVGSNNAVIPSSSTQIGGSDGTNLQAARVFDADTGVGSEYVLGAVLRKSASGGSVEAGTSSDPLRIDPTGTTTQPVSDAGGSLTVDTTQLPAALVGGRLDSNVGAWLGSTAPSVGSKTSANSIPVVIASDQGAVAVSGTVTSNIGTTGGLALDATLTGGTQKAIVRGGAKGATTAADVTSTAEGVDHQALDVQIYHGGSAIDPTQIRALTNTDVVSSEVTKWIGSTAPTVGQKTSASSIPVVISSDQSAVTVTGTVTATNPSVGSTGAAVPASATQMGGSDGTNLQAPRVFDADSGAGSQYVLGAVLRKTASGGSVEAGTSSDPLRVDPTGTTTQPVSDAGGSLTVDTTQLPAALVGGRLDANVGAWLGSTAPSVGSKTSANSIPVVIASDQGAVTVSGTVTANVGTTGGLALDATLTGGTAKAIVRGGAKGATTAADVTSTAEGVDHQALDVQIYHGGSAVNPTQIRALTSSDVVTAAQGTAAALSGYWPVRVTDGTNTMPTGDAVGRAVFEKITDGTNTAAVKAASTAAVAADPALVVAISPNTAPIGQVVGSQGNAWNAAATGANGNSASIDCQYTPFITIFGTSSGNTVMSVQASQDNTNFYTVSTFSTGTGDFGTNLTLGCRYVRLQSATNRTVTATIAGKSG